MNRNLKTYTTGRSLQLLGLAASLALPLPALAAALTLATSPLATSTTSSVKPNLMLVLDNSGSMDWDHMPDDASDGGSAVSFSFGYYGLRSSQCNQVYYDPSLTYTPPVKADGTSYTNSSFINAWTNGFNTGAGTINLDTSFRASQSLNGDSTGQSAYYYLYTGSQTTALQKNYNSTTNIFYNECHSANGAAPGSAVFSKQRLATTETTTIVVGGSTTSNSVVSSIKVNGVELMNGNSVGHTTTSTVAANIAAKISLGGYSATASGSTITITGPTSAANYTPVVTVGGGTLTFTSDVFPDTTPASLTNFANWYSYYRTRMLMMKTATGRAFQTLDNNYRVGLMKISSSGTPTVPVGTFETTQRSTWYTSLYGTTVSGSTPLRTALSDAGRYYAGQLTGTDPIQYSCQQNFTILSTDGYWNTGDGYKLDGTTAVGNQDGTAARPMYDGAHTTTIWTLTYTRNDYSKVSSNCGGSQRKLQTQPQIGSCTVTVAGASCIPASWSSNGASYTSGSCMSSSSITYPGGVDPSLPVQQGAAVESTGTSGGSSDNLADIAMYYYQTDLRTSALGNCTGAISGEDVCTNNVFLGGNDNNVQQHMTTFTLGLGASGWMTYSPSYQTDTIGDYVAVKLGSTANSTASPPICSWQADGTTCNWPVPGMSGSDGLIANVDDLWHAAVNGHGAYYSATNPSTLSTGLSNALLSVKARQGSAAAAATSTLNPVAGNNLAFVASYTTVKWQGNLEGRGMNVDTGVVDTNATWCVENVTAGTCTAPSSIVLDTSGATNAYYCVTPNSIVCPNGLLDGTDCKVPVATACTGTMNARVADASDNRTIYTANDTGTALTPFDSTYAAAHAGYFSQAHINTLSQWPSLTATQQAAAEGTNLINFLRGQNGYEERSSNPVANRLYRYREAVMGDALESQPTFLANPLFSYSYTGYSAFAAAQVSRPGTVFIGTNDGMLHAFVAKTDASISEVGGYERWAYVPSMVVPEMWRLADTSYANHHRNFVNGSPITSDVYCTANCGGTGGAASWRTILVSGLAGGGRGYFALDITNPNSPTLLWEFTTTAGIGHTQNDDVGYAYGKPAITRKADGTWVVLLPSGYNNSESGLGNGQGHLFVLDAYSGNIISKISTGTGSATTPSGLSKIAVWNNAAAGFGNEAGYVYGGDLQGNIWRFDINSTTAAAIGTGSVLKFATLYSDAAGTNPQPITTAPTLGSIGGKRVIFVGTGKYLETSDLTTTQVQTYYAIKDDDATATLVNPRNTLVQQTLTNNLNGTRSESSNPVNFSTGRGWYVDFPDTGERMNIDSRLIQGVIIAPTIVPSNTACSPGGYSWKNYLCFDTGAGCGTMTRTDATIVGINIVYIAGRPVVSYVTSDNPTPEVESNPINFTAPGREGTFIRHRSTWRELYQ